MIFFQTFLSLYWNMEEWKWVGWKGSNAVNNWFFFSLSTGSVEDTVRHSLAIHQQVATLGANDVVHIQQIHQPNQQSLHLPQKGKSVTFHSSWLLILYVLIYIFIRNEEESKVYVIFSTVATLSSGTIENAVTHLMLQHYINQSLHLLIRPALVAQALVSRVTCNAVCPIGECDCFVLMSFLDFLQVLWCIGSGYFLHVIWKYQSLHWSGIFGL